MAARSESFFDIVNSGNLQIRHAQPYRNEPKWRIAAFRPDYNCLFYVRNGRGWVRMASRKMEALPGDYFIWRSGKQVAAGHDKRHPTTVDSTGFFWTGPGQQNMLELLHLPLRLRLPLRDRKRMTAFHRNLFSTHGGTTMESKVSAKGHFLLLLGELLRLSRTLPPSRKILDAGPSSSDNLEIDACRTYMDVHFNQPLTLESLAEQANLNPTYFGTRFKKAFGMTPMTYLREKRLERARLWLLSTDWPVQRIAREVGYPDAYYFSRVFTKSAGTSPTAFRKEGQDPFDNTGRNSR